MLSVAIHRVVELTEESRSKVLCLLLHSADVSNPAKPWDIHTRWTARIMEEFFQQGDREKQLSLPPSPLCDRNTTNIPGSQLGEDFQYTDTAAQKTLVYDDAVCTSACMLTMHYIPLIVQLNIFYGGVSIND